MNNKIVRNYKKNELSDLLQFINSELKIVEELIRITDTTQTSRFHYLQGQENILKKIKRKITSM